MKIKMDTTQFASMLQGLQTPEERIRALMESGMFDDIIEAGMFDKLLATANNKFWDNIKFLIGIEKRKK